MREATLTTLAVIGAEADNSNAGAGSVWGTRTFSVTGGNTGKLFFKFGYCPNE